jgi:hypothetical protein
MRALNPPKAIVPIVIAGNQSPAESLLGTGFFVDTAAGPQIITAKHLCGHDKLEEGLRYAVAFREKSAIRIIAVRTILGHPKADVAMVVPGESFLEAVPLPIAEEDPPLGRDIFSYDYSTTRIERQNGGGPLTSFEPLFHKGHVQRYYTSTFPEAHPTPCFLTSFPALQGASGAPVLAGSNTKDITVIGMLVANLEQHLLPAQIVTLDDPTGHREETRYFLPSGKALGLSVLREAIPWLAQAVVKHREMNGDR